MKGLHVGDPGMLHHVAMLTLMCIGLVNSQTTSPPPLPTMNAPTQANQPTTSQGIVIMGCPPVIEPAYAKFSGSQVYWNPPTAGNLQPSTDTSPGSYFNVGVTLVTYVFSDLEGNTAVCEFNVTVLKQCPSTTDQSCDNGVCVPQSTSCDGFNDCGDGPSFRSSDEGYGECPLTAQSCRLSEQMLYGFCAQSLQWENATGATRQDVNGRENTVFEFLAPWNATELTYLPTVRINVTDIIDLQQKEVDSPTVFLSISTSSYSMAARAQVPRANDQQLFDDFLEIEIRLPLLVQPNERVLVSMEFDDNILTGRPPFPAEGTNLTSVRALFVTLMPGCDNSNCFAAYIAWKTLQSEAGGQTSCGIPERNELIQSIYGPCLSMLGPPEFEFVSPSMSRQLEARVVLKCIGRAAVIPPLVEWREDGNVVTSGFGAAAFDLIVGSESRSFRCVLDSDIVYEEIVTVSEWSAECESLSQDVSDLTQGNPCINFQSLTLNNFGQFEGLRYSALVLEPGVAYGLQLPSFSLSNPEPDYGQGEMSQTGVLLPIRLSITRGQLTRKRREVNANEIYTREYRNMYIPASGHVDFHLDPPFSVNANELLEVTMTVLENPGGFIVAGRQSGLVDVLSCSGNSTCEILLEDWSRKQQSLEVPRCNQEGNLPLAAYQICRGASLAEPVVITHPESQDITLIPGVDGVQEGTAVMTCFIENAVEYSWYKVAPIPSRTFVKAGSTLSFRVSDNSRPNDQGSYVCVGKGGAPHNTTVETRPATLTIEDFDMFKVTARVGNLTYSSNLSDPTSQAYMERSTQVIGQFFGLTDFVPASGYDFEIVGFTPGSVIVDVITYVGQPPTDQPDFQLAEAILAYLMVPNGESPNPLEDITIVSLVTCVGEQVDGLTFPSTKVGLTAESTEHCPEFTSNAGLPMATRDCAGNIESAAYWLAPVPMDCLSGEDDVNDLLEDLSTVEVTNENVEEVTRGTVLLTSNYSQIDASGIMATADILEKIVGVDMPSTEVALDVVRVVNNILQVDEETYEDLGEDPSPSRIILALEAYITELQTSNSTGNLTAVHSNVAVVAVVVPQDSLRIGLGFAAVPQGVGQPGDSPLTEDDVIVYFEPEAIPIPEVKASIVLPREILNFVSPGDSVPISFFLYQSSKLFRSPKLRSAARPTENFSRAIGSYIIAATVEGVRVQDLPMEAPVSSAFLPIEIGGPNDTVNGSECVFWDFNLNNNFGDWSTEGCRKVTINNTRTVCHCDHLTSFAVIVDIYGNQDNIVLSIISKIGCAVSLVALVITIITYLAIKKLRDKRPQQILIHFSFALAGLYLVFLVGIEATGSGAGCIIVAALIHFFTLASVSWMAVEATNMYLLFVRVLNANVSHFLLIASILAWGLPLVVVVVILAVDHTNYIATDYCFLRPDNAFYFGQILPIGLILIYNFIIFTLVMRQLTCARKSIKSSSDRTQRQEIMRRLQNALAISVLLGLTWVFGLLSLVQTANFAFQIIFCVFNSLQGLMIFLLFCMRQQEIRQAWWQALTCQCRKKRAADYSKGTGSKSRDGDSQGQGTMPLTHRSTDNTNTR